MNRFNNVLQKRINIENEERIAQDALKDKYGIEDRSKTVVIEKPSLVKLFIRIIKKGIHTIIIATITFLSAIGIISILLPNTREFLSTTFLQAFEIIWSSI